MKRILTLGALICLINISISAQSLQSENVKSVITQKQKILNNASNSKATKIWGYGASTGAADGEFQNGFVNATSFSFGTNPTSWTALTVSESSGNVTPGNAYWTRTTSGVSQGAYNGNIAPISSPTVQNGAAIFDSDFLDNAGIPNNFGGGSSPSFHKGELISPRMDLSGYTDSALAVQFYTFYREFSINELSVSFSADDGTTWTTTDYRTLIGDLQEGFVDVVFPNVTVQ